MFDDTVTSTLASWRHEALPLRLSIAWLVLLLGMAVFLGYQGACAFLASAQLDAAYTARVQAVNDMSAAERAKNEADQHLARADALLLRAQDALRKQADHAPRAFQREGFDAGQVSSL